MYKVYTKTSIGSRHMEKGIVCQDFSDSYCSSKVKIAAVSDGHGSRQYFRSDRGAKFAVEAAIQCLCEFANGFSGNTKTRRKIPLTDLFDQDKQSALMKQLYKSILIRWYELVEDDYKKDPFSEADLAELPDKYKHRYLSGKYLSAYGTTLIAALVTKKYWLGIHIGDGKFVLINRQCECSRPIPWDDDCTGPVTTSICQDDAVERFRYYISDNMPMALCFGSDGVDDTYGDGEILDTFYKQLIMEFADEGFAYTAKEIEKLLPDITKKGSHDDISIGLIFDTEIIKSNHRLLALQINITKFKDEIIRLQEKINRSERKLTNISLNNDESAKESLEKEIKELKDILEYKKSELEKAETMAADINN